MRKKAGLLFSFLFALSLCFCGMFFLSAICPVFKPFESASAEESIESPQPTWQNGYIQIQQDGLSFQMTAKSRLANQTWQIEKKTISSAEGNLQYYFFKWRQLDSFEISISNISSEKSIESYEFSAQHVSADYSLEQNIESPIEFGSSGTNTQSLANGGFFVSNATLGLTYYIDQNVSAESQTVKSGFGFGAYKFDFEYAYPQDESSIHESMTILIAVVPDDIVEAVEKAQANNTILTYSIEQPKEILNTYRLSFSSDAFDYVNPEYLQWQAVGTGKDNKKYVLYKAMCEENVKYAGYIPLNNDSYGTTGSSYVFDSKGVEGTWTVSVKVKGSDFSLVSPELSTIAEPKPNLWWMWLLIAFAIALGIGGIVFLAIFIQKKREKVW